jgi:MFS family permease
MAFWLTMLVAMLMHSSYKGSKVLASLFAIDLGAGAFTIGVLYAVYSLFAVILSFFAGRASDRYGFRPPILIGASGMLVSLLLPYFLPGLTALFASAAVAGTCYIFYVVSIQHLIGALSAAPERTRNYGVFSICIGLTSLVGPTVTGFSIDHLGHRETYLLLAAFPALTTVVLLCYPRLLPRAIAHDKPAGQRHFMDLLRNAPLRRVLLTTAFLEAGNELFNFLIPIYGNSIGLSASQIGIVMGSFALAVMGVRTVMPELVRRSNEERVFSASLLVAAAACAAIPLVPGFAPLLAVSFVLGLGTGCCAPLSMVLSYNRAPTGRAGEAIGLRQTVNKAIESTVPALFGALSTALGFVPVYCLGALLLAGGGWLMHRDAGGRRAQAARAPEG